MGWRDAAQPTQRSRKEVGGPGETLLLLLLPLYSHSFLAGDDHFRSRFEPEKCVRIETRGTPRAKGASDPTGRYDMHKKETHHITSIGLFFFFKGSVTWPSTK